MHDYQYDVAVSFAGEDRSIAEGIAQRLDAAGYSVSYDDFEAEKLWGSDLPVKLGKIYGEQARFCVMLVSRHYVSKMWTNHERQYAISRLMKERDEYVLPVRIDDTEVPGLPPGIGHVSLERYSLGEIFGLLLKKLGEPGRERTKPSLAAEDQRAVEEVLQACNRRALFTRMNSEINLEAMFDSIGRCIGLLQRFGPQFRSSELQHLTLELSAYFWAGKNFLKLAGIASSKHRLSEGARYTLNPSAQTIIGYSYPIADRAGY